LEGYPEYKTQVLPKSFLTDPRLGASVWLKEEAEKRDGDPSCEEAGKRFANSPNRDIRVGYGWLFYGLLGAHPEKTLTLRAASVPASDCRLPSGSLDVLSSTS
jgi:hypothetical protein